MQAYLEVIGVLAVVLLGLTAGKIFSRFKGSYWLIGYFISLVLAILLVLPRLYYPLHFAPFFSELLAGRARFIVLAIAVTVGLVAPLDRLPRKLEQVLVCTVMAIVLGWFSVMPFLAPAVLQKTHASLRTTFNYQGVCFQTTDYTCGPAAAVTALHKLGIEADEGQIAILSHSSPVTGTLPQCLADALNKQYAGLGLDFKFRMFDSIEQLNDSEVTLVVIKDHFLSDHCIAVLDVTKDRVIVADPVSGICVLTHEYFAEKWRFSGIAIKHTVPQTEMRTKIASGTGQSHSI
ncbi:MAG: cysteine peptidase family C39 domain-containing protein [Phycisphaerae bacterium]|jgi:predicted double-glycine peptidase